MVGIYKITNKLNQKSYIGQSIHIEQRWEEHLYKSSTCSLLKYALYKYGKDNFTFEVIEECEQSLLNEREQYWIKYYNTFEEGYNLTRGGEGSAKYEIENIYETFQQCQSIEQTAKKIGCSISTARRVLREYGINLHEQSDAKPVEQIDPETLQTIQVYSSIQEAADAIGVHHSSLTMALNGRHDSSGGYLWKYKDQDKQFSTKKIKQWQTKVAQVNKNTDEIIQIFNSAADAAEYCGKDRKNGGSQITAVCSGRKKTAFGFKWKKI